MNNNKNWYAPPRHRNDSRIAASGDAGGDLHFTIFHGRDGLAKLRDAWLALESAASDMPFYQSYKWYECMLAHLASEEDTYLFVLATRRDTVVAIFPFRLEIETEFGFKYQVLDLPTHPHVMLRGAALHPGVHDTDIFARLVRYLERCNSPGWDVLRIRRVPAHSPIDNLCQMIDSRLRVSWSSGSISRRVRGREHS